MRRLVPATLLTLSLSAPAFAGPERTFELPTGTTLDRIQSPQTPPQAPAKAPELRNPWLAAGLTLGAPLLVSGLSYYGSAASGQGDLYSVTPAIAVAGPLSLMAGHLYTGALARGGAVMLGGYVAEALGAVIAAPAIALASGKEGEGAGFAFLSGLFIGPLIALGVYGAGAALDAYMTTLGHNERALKEAEPAATP